MHRLISSVFPQRTGRRRRGSGNNSRCVFVSLLGRLGEQAEMNGLREAAGGADRHVLANPHPRRPSGFRTRRPRLSLGGRDPASVFIASRVMRMEMTHRARRAAAGDVGCVRTRRIAGRCGNAVGSLLSGAAFAAIGLGVASAARGLRIQAIEALRTDP